MMRKFMKKSYSNKRGMCLVELIVSVCLYSIVLICVFKLLTLNLQVYLGVRNNYRESMEVNYAFEYIINEIQASDEIYYTGHIDRINKNHPSNIGFILKNIDIMDADSCKYIFYYQVDNKLYRSAHSIKTSRSPYDLNFKMNSNLLADSIVSIGSEMQVDDLLELSINSKKSYKKKYLDLNYKIKKYSQEDRT